MTEDQRDILRHALGYGGRNPGYRNHFVTGPGSTDYPHCEALVAAGMMTKRAGTPLSGGDDIYSVTDAGRAALKTPNALAQADAACGVSPGAMGSAALVNTDEE